MPMIKAILITRDNISEDEADELIKEARKAFYYYLKQGDETSAYEVCAEYFGLEPDYLYELI